MQDDPRPPTPPAAASSPSSSFSRRSAPPPPFVPLREVNTLSARQRVLASVAILALLASLTVFGVSHALTQIKATGRSQAAAATATAVQRAATATATPVPPTATPAPVPALATQGNRIVNTATGQTVRLIGAARSSLEYECQGDQHFALADFQAMRSWGMNAVRIPLWTRFWLNIDNSCPTYQQTVAGAVANAEAAGLYVILTIQWNAACAAPSDYFADHTPDYQYPMPDAKTDAQMWQQLAGIYKADTHVIFDIFSEPHYISWSVWYNGGPITTSSGCTYQAIGMNALAEQVRASAPNLIIVSGNDWGYDLSQIGNGYAIKASNVVYGTHPFEYGDKEPGYWQNSFGNTAAHYPVIATEFGEYDCQTGYIGQAISYFNAHQMSWLAWNWSVVPPSVTAPCDPTQFQGPFLLASWSGTPMAPYGVYIRDQMLAAKP